MSHPLPEEVQNLLNKAEDAIVHAEYNFKEGFLTVTANRTYYSSFYCMTALLYTLDIHPGTHQGMHTKFSEHFIKKGIFPKEISKTVTLLFDNRQNADYDFDSNLTKNEASELISKATEFLHLTKNYFDDLTADKNAAGG